MTDEAKTEEKEKNETKEKVVRILTNKKLSAIKTMLEKDHAIDCLFLLMLDRGQWKYAKNFMRKLRLTLPDGTLRARMIEIEDRGLARHEKMEAKKKRWVITEFGKLLSKLLLDLFGKTTDGG